MRLHLNSYCSSYVHHFGPNVVYAACFHHRLIQSYLPRHLCSWHGCLDEVEGHSNVQARLTIGLIMFDHIEVVIEVRYGNLGAWKPIGQVLSSSCIHHSNLWYDINKAADLLIDVGNVVIILWTCFFVLRASKSYVYAIAWYPTTSQPDSVSQLQLKWHPSNEL